MAGPTEETSLVGGKGPKDLEGRRCTDLLCLVFFGAFWVGMISLTSVIYAHGDINKIFYGTDYLGNTCGFSENTTGRTKVWYPRIGEDVLEQSASIASGFFWDVNLYGVCVPSCPTYNPAVIETVADYGYGWSPDARAASWGVYIGTVDLFNRCLQETQEQTVSIDLCTIPNCTTVGAPCYSLGGGSVDVPEGSWDISTHSAAACAREVTFTYGARVRQPGATAYLDWLFTSVGTIKDTWESLWANLGAIMSFGVGLSIVVNFIWLVLLYLFARIAVWSCIFLILVGTLLGAVFCFVKAGITGVVIAAADNSTIGSLGLNLSSSLGLASSIVTTASADDTWMYWTGGTILTILFLLFCISVCCSCKAISRCVVLVQQGSLAIGSSPGLSLLPLPIVLLQLGLITGVVLTLLALTTLGTDGTYTERLAHTSATVQDGIIGAYLIFGGLWTYAFLTALELMTVAACVFYFYFVNRSSVPADAYMKQFDDNQTRLPTLTHLGWVMRYHLGTLAFGSLIVAIITFIQLCTKAIFQYLEKNTPLGTNMLVKIVASCIQCCLSCFKKTIEFVNSYAYIYVFVENISFCSGCMRTFGLICSYPAQIAINSSVQMVLATLLSITTPLFCAVAAFIYFDYMAPDAANHAGAGGLLLPGAVLVIAFVMSRAFAAMWEQVIQSLTVCVLHDVDHYDGRFLREPMKAVFGYPTKAVKQ